MKIPLSLVAVEVLFALCDAYTLTSKGNNYLQLMRAQKFMQIQTNSSKLYHNRSEDLDELDAYEEMERGKEENVTNHNNMDTLEFKNIEALMRNKENDFTVDQTIGNGRACTISEKGFLDVSINDANIFNVHNYLVQITSSSILITEYENEKKRNIIKTIPFESIKLPIETIEETRECWKLKTHSENIMFCEKNKNERDIWIQNILKALFCYNTNNLRIENNLFERSETFELPKESTIEKRLQESKKNTILENKNKQHKPKPSHRTTDYVSEDISEFDLDINE